MEKNSQRRELIGIISSNKMDKTVVVTVKRRVPHPVYKKFVNKTKKYYAHDSKKMCEIGDSVVIEESKPLSKLKRWRIKTIEKKAIS